jgi:hypothetical protein
VEFIHNSASPHYAGPIGPEPNPKPNLIPILLGGSAESGTSQASGGNCDENFAEDKAKKKPIADHVLIGMKMVICYRGMTRGAADLRDQAQVAGLLGEAVNDVC